MTSTKGDQGLINSLSLTFENLALLRKVVELYLHCTITAVNY